MCAAPVASSHGEPYHNHRREIKRLEAFDLAWPQIVLSYGAATEIQLEQLRNA